MSFSDVYAVSPLTRPPDCTVQVPGSKSLTNRALILAALAEPHAGMSESVLENALQSDDTDVMLKALCRLGIPAHQGWDKDRLIVPCVPQSSWTKSTGFFCGNSGTTLRFLTALLATAEGEFRLDGVTRMRERPIQDLIHALRSLGVDIQSELNNGCPPVVLKSQGLPGGIVQIRGGVSSQFLSGLLMAAPYAQGPVTIQIDGQLVSVPYVMMTLAIMRQWGVTVTMEGQSNWTNRRFFVTPQRYRARQFAIEPDASSASYFWAAAAITGGRVTVPGLEKSCQGDIAFRDLLVKMGCRHPNPNTIEGGPLRGIDVDMNAISDTVMTLAVVALFAEGPTRIRNIAHIRHKETDRIAALATELRKVGAGVVEHDDGLTIHPGPLHGAELDTYRDHRMAMSLALIGLRVPSIVIRDPGCVAKTFPGYWTVLEKLKLS